MIARRLANGIRAHFGPRMPEWGLTAMLLATSADLEWAAASFAAWPSHAVLALFVTRTQWGVLAGAIGAVWLVALFCNGTFEWFARLSPWARSVAAFLAAGYWTLTGTCLWLATGVSLGALHNYAFAAMALACSILTAREVGLADGKARCVCRIL